MSRAQHRIPEMATTLQPARKPVRRLGTAQRALAPLALLAICIGTAGCAPDPTDTALQEGVVRSVGILLEDVRSSLHDGSFDSLGAFVEENGIPLGEASADRGVGLPWLLAAGAGAAEVQSTFAEFGPTGVRDPVVLGVESAGTHGTVRLFMRMGTTDSVGFGRHLFVYHACVDLAIDVEFAAAIAVRTECTELPPALTMHSNDLPREAAEVGRMWPAS